MSHVVVLVAKDSGSRQTGTIQAASVTQAITEDGIAFMAYRGQDAHISLVTAVQDQCTGLALKKGHLLLKLMVELQAAA